MEQGQWAVEDLPENRLAENRSKSESREFFSLHKNRFNFEFRNPLTTKDTKVYTKVTKNKVNCIYLCVLCVFSNFETFAVKIFLFLKFFYPDVFELYY
jgi:hypothetical protein